MNDVKAKQEIVDKINASTNVLVSVSNSPSVDALSAAIGLTLLLNKIGKHTTAIFSGTVPAAIAFLNPQKTFEASTDSLRDFIIALDKEKADHLRYKVEGDMVKIFITPYRTTISNEDLEFSQGDYNVELVLALGVENQSHLDGALEAHGSILHDATVATISAGQQTSSLGSIDWRDDAASSLGEMLVDLADALKSDVPLMDDQIATALLTGIVAETDRFSNVKTSSKVMTIAAKLMAAGADQQLISAKLQESHTIDTPAPVGAVSMVGNTIVPADVTTLPADGLAIAHDEPVASTLPQPEVLQPVVPEAADLPNPAPAPVSSPDPVVKIADAYALDPTLPEEPAPVTEPTVAPLLGGVSAPQPAPIVTPPAPEPDAHSYLSDDLSSSPSTGGEILGHNNALMPTPTVPTPSVQPSEPAPLGAPAAEPQVDALAAVHASFDGSTPAPAAAQPAVAPPVMPTSIPLPPPPPVPDFSAFPPASSTVAPAYALDPISAPAPAPLAPPPAAAAPDDPAQFRIPGQ